jgi:hypothetical protein
MVVVVVMVLVVVVVAVVVSVPQCEQLQQQFRNIVHCSNLRSFQNNFITLFTASM